MANNDSWMIAEVPGPKKASVITKVEVAEAIIRRARRPVLVIGGLAAEIEVEDRKLIDYLIEIAQKGKIPVVATAHSGGELRKKGCIPAMSISAVDLGNRLLDPSWVELGGKSPPDLALFGGLPYCLATTLLAGLKNFAPGLKTMTLDNVYHPNASWSFGNLSIRDWVTNLRSIIAHLQE